MNKLKLIENFCNLDDQNLRLKFGEMTPQELRTLRAGLNQILRIINYGKDENVHN